MKPLKLHMENFGPYENETIDFTELNKSSVFLISGNTGSGKTTILTRSLLPCTARESLMTGTPLCCAPILRILIRQPKWIYV